MNENMRRICRTGAMLAALMFLFTAYGLLSAQETTEPLPETGRDTVATMQDGHGEGTAGETTATQAEEESEPPPDSAPPGLMDFFLSGKYITIAVLMVAGIISSFCSADG